MIPTGFTVLGTGGKKKYYPPDDVQLTDWLKTQGWDNRYGDYFVLDPASSEDAIYNRSYVTANYLGGLYAILMARDLGNIFTSSLSISFGIVTSAASFGFFTARNASVIEAIADLKEDDVVIFRASKDKQSVEIKGVEYVLANKISPVAANLVYRVGISNSAPYNGYTVKSKYQVIYRGGELKYIYASGVQAGKAVIVDLVSQRVFPSFDNGGNLPVISGPVSQQQYITI